MLRDSPGFAEGNFAAISGGDLARLFKMYDDAFFSGRLSEDAVEASARPLLFRVSSRMTRAAGKTITHRRRGILGNRIERFEIAVSSRLLFSSFRDIERPVVVCGMRCRDRLEALQRTMEHEIVHLAEILTWGKSSCSSRRFKTLAKNLFGHSGIRHDLVTPHEKAKIRHGISVGDRVEFRFKGARIEGFVNRLSVRATVLVESQNGRRYTDGKTYLKYYIPLKGLFCSG